jgi:hypothetical protein
VRADNALDLHPQVPIVVDMRETPGGSRVGLSKCGDRALGFCAVRIAGRVRALRHQHDSVLPRAGFAGCPPARIPPDQHVGVGAAEAEGRNRHGRLPSPVGPPAGEISEVAMMTESPIGESAGPMAKPRCASARSSAGHGSWIRCQRFPTTAT